MRLSLHDQETDWSQFITWYGHLIRGTCRHRVCSDRIQVDDAGQTIAILAAPTVTADDSYLVAQGQDRVPGQYQVGLPAGTGSLRVRLTYTDGSVIETGPGDFAVAP